MPKYKIGDRVELLDRLCITPCSKPEFMRYLPEGTVMVILAVPHAGDDERYTLVEESKQNLPLMERCPHEHSLDSAWFDHI